MPTMQHRCTCNKLLAESRDLRGTIAIKCPRCGRLYTQTCRSGGTSSPQDT
nr:MAG TPA: DNA-directed RNA polymerase [Caudoviricetes sp.]DAX69486.1 MAG TPA: DNA-directed RNA polymerase [Caudoviricetes sp.]